MNSLFSSSGRFSPMKKLSSVVLLALIGLLCFGSLTVDAQKVLLRDVTSVTLRRGEYTTGRRSAPVAQLVCSGGTAYGKFSPKVVQCVNRGFDGIDVQWECKADMPLDYEFGKISVSCEGYDYANDPYILAGSCGLNYELDYSSAGAQKKSYKPYADTGINYTNIIYFGVACFVIYLIYTSLSSPREGSEGDRRRGGGGGFDNGPPPPPGWRPNGPPPSAPPPYEESSKYSTGANAGCGTNTNANANTSSGPGFFTGMGLGALGGYLFGNRNTGYNGYGNSYRRRNPGYTQFDRDTGFHDSNYNEPSTSRGYFGGGGGGGRSSSGSGSGTHTSSGFGGTSRR